MTQQLKNRDRIWKEGFSILESHPQGIRWMRILNKAIENLPDLPRSSIKSSLIVFLRSNDDQVKKISRGEYILRKYDGEDSKSELQPVLPSQEGQKSIQSSILEVQFYEPFAEWLKHDIEEANSALPVGGNFLKTKWGTPDVVGVLKPMPNDPVKFAVQIVAAEIKTDINQLVVAFGQAAAYRLFAHKTYVAVPNNASKPDINRLKMLCEIYGIGLVTFKLNPQLPEFDLRVHAKSTEPDMYYVNEMARSLIKADDRFNTMF